MVTLNYFSPPRWSDVECLSEASALCEISLDGNPITQEVTYKQVVLKNMPQLRQLDMKRITVRYNVMVLQVLETL